MSTTRSSGSSGEQWVPPLVGGAISGLVIGWVMRRYPDIGLPVLMAIGLVNALVFQLVIRAFGKRKIGE